MRHITLNFWVGLSVMILCLGVVALMPNALEAKSVYTGHTGSFSNNGYIERRDDTEGVENRPKVTVSETVDITELSNSAEEKQPVTAKSDKTYALLYQLNGSSMESLSQASVVIADPDFGADNSSLDATKVRTLQQGGTEVILYTSIGEASDFRAYWAERNYSNKQPSFLLDANRAWKGAFKVKFWDKTWQKIVFDDVESIARRGANGIYLDIVDGYQDAGVIRAYSEDQRNGLVPSNKTVREAMEDFVIAISRKAKSFNPGIKVFPQNAVGLLTENGEGERSNRPYLNAIDGIGIEDTWTNGNTVVDWTEGNLKSLKFINLRSQRILSTDYPTDKNLQEAFVENAIKQGFIPFVGARALSKSVPVINKDTPEKLGW